MHAGYSEPTCHPQNCSFWKCLVGSVALSSFETEEMRIHFRFVITIAGHFRKSEDPPPRASRCGLSCSVFCFRVT
jgi:hypothetical protein